MFGKTLSFFVVITATLACNPDPKPTSAPPTAAPPPAPTPAPTRPPTPAPTPAPTPGSPLPQPASDSWIFATRGVAAGLIAMKPTSKPVPDSLKSLPDLPIQGSSVGGLTKAGLIVCVSYRLRNPSFNYNDCFRYDSASNAWLKTATRTPIPPQSMFSIHPTLGILATGGYRIQNQPVLSNEVVSTVNGVTFNTNHARMPVNMREHCQVLVDTDTLIILSALNRQKMYKMSISANSWTTMPTTMPVDRPYICGAVNSGRELVYVAKNRESDVYKLNLATNSWRKMRALPYVKNPFVGSHAVPLGSGTFLAFKDSDTPTTLYEYQPNSDTWKHMPESFDGHNPTARVIVASRATPIAASIVDPDKFSAPAKPKEWIFATRSKSTGLISLDPAKNPIPDCLLSMPDLPPGPSIPFSRIGGQTSAGLIVCVKFEEVVGPKEVLFMNCYRLDPAAKKWIKTADHSPMPYTQQFSIHPRYGIIASGGYNRFERPAKKSTVGSTVDGVTFKTHAPMPSGNDQHCQVLVDDDTIVVLSELSQKKVFKMSLSANSWTTLATTMPEEAPNICGVVNAKQVVYVTRRTKILNMLDIQTLAWKKLRTLPFSQSFFFSHAIPYDNTLLAFDEVRSEAPLYKYNPSTDTWSKMPEGWSGGNWAVIGFPVSSDYFPKCSAPPSTPKPKMWLLATRGKNLGMISKKPSTLPVPENLRSLPDVPYPNGLNPGLRVGGATQAGFILCVEFTEKVGSVEVKFTNCHRWDKARRNWVKTADRSPMAFTQQYSLHPTYGIIASGGYNRFERPAKKSTVVSTVDGATFKTDHAPMPQGGNQHCQVLADDDTLVVFAEVNTRKVYQMSLSGNQWTTLSTTMPEASPAFCGALNNRNVLYATRKDRAVNMLNLDNLSWRKMRSLPFPPSFWLSTAVAHLEGTDKTLLAFHEEQSSTTLYRYVQASDTWVAMPESFSGPPNEYGPVRAFPAYPNLFL